MHFLSTLAVIDLRSLNKPIAKCLLLKVGAFAAARAACFSAVPQYFADYLFLGFQAVFQLLQGS